MPAFCPSRPIFLFFPPSSADAEAGLAAAGRCSLLLSLSVTGINVAFSYIGNYFTNALVKKNQEMAYLFVGFYFCGFLVGIPIVAFYGYVRDYLGMHWREWMTTNFLGNYFKDRNY